MNKAEELKQEFKKWWPNAERELHCAHDLGDSRIVARKAWEAAVDRLSEYAQQVSRENKQTTALQFAMYVTEEFERGTYQTFAELWNEFNQTPKQ